jgi:DNA-binding beta-propeller fold protein YncE
MTRALHVLVLATGAWGAALCLPACDESPPQAAGVQLVVGRTGFGPREFSYPRAAVLDPRGRLYVVDKAARIQCFTPELAFVCAWRMPAWDAGKPTGLGIGPDGRVYAADTHYSRVVVFEPDGRLVQQFGTRGQGPGQFLLPTDVAVDQDGFVYVAEYGGNDRISKFTPDLRYLFSFGRPGAGPGELQRPQSLLLDADGTLWVADACNHRICHFTRDGDYLGSFGESGTGLGQLRFPYGIDRLSDGTLLVCEYGNNRLQRFDRAGHALGVWGTPGRHRGQLAYPWALAVGAHDRVYIVDSGNNRIQVLDATAPGVWQSPAAPPMSRP